MTPTIHQKRSYSDFHQILGRPFERLFEETQEEELFSVEKLEQYAMGLAEELQVTSRTKKGKSLRPELKKNSAELEEAYDSLAKAIRDKQIVSPAAEWFVDNFHIIESQIREIKLSLPDNYYYGLPQLTSGHLKGYPRVYAIALAIMSHTDSRIDPDTLQKFLTAFQRVAPLEIGELWAIVITMRFVLVQHLTVLAKRIVRSRANRDAANAFADKLFIYLHQGERTPSQVQDFMKSNLGDASTFSRSYMVQLIQRMRDQDDKVWPAQEWIDKELNKFKTDSGKVTQLELYRLAASQVTVGNIIGSMRLISSLDWRDFFERISLSDAILRQDPAGVYATMDFQTRDGYRHMLERISKRSELSEIEVAERVVEAAKSSTPVARHIGYHLIGAGRYDFQKSCGYRPYLRSKVHEAVLKNPTTVYLSLIVITTLLFLYPVVNYYAQLARPQWELVLFTLLALLPASEIALSFINHYVTYLMKPHPLPRIDTEKGIPGTDKTMIVIPTLFTKELVVRELIERLEIHALANMDKSLSYALLGDFADAPTETLQTDDYFTRVALSGIAELNARYCQDEGPRFHLFVRKRLWNEAEGAWIGWERKRGKLLEFNHLLRGASDTSYVVHTASPELMAQIKYVITLDSDTQLPRGAAQKLVGTILHPLNKPQFDAAQGRVVAGYGILQPRISITSESAQATRFARISSGNIGLDPYTTAVSDVYQDMFQEGSFTGKGLYVVDEFELALENRVPENAVLSHDLFEGSYARSALVTDVELYDDYPGDYETFSKRQHRWTRGDWQILPWLFPRVRDARGKLVKNHLSLISRWKIFDNLRRSLVPVTIVLWLLLAWTVLPGSPAYWTTAILLIYLFPVYSTVATGDWLSRKGMTWQGHFMGTYREFKIKIGQILISMIFLMQNAWTQADAIIRVSYRMLISKKKLMEWTSFAQLSGQKQRPFAFKSLLSSGTILSALSIGVVSILRPSALPIAAPFLVLWVLNPWIKEWLKQTPAIEEAPLTDSELSQFRFYSRLTWHFFETFTTRESNWLAPDNFQEDPKPVVAFRTSPTNIGLQLLASASAYDLGYVGHVELIEGLERTMDSIRKLQTMNGHFFNWYDIQTLEPLHPRYISTVDSGNLAGHLLTFKQFLIELSGQKRSYRQLQNGIEDTLGVLLFNLGQAAAHDLTTGAAGLGQVRTLIEKLLSTLRNPIATEEQWRGLLNHIERELTEAKDILETLTLEQPELTAELLWMKSALIQVKEFKRDVLHPRRDLIAREDALIDACDEFAMRMDFRFLFDEKRKLFVIGYNVNDNRLDNSYYDLLASESRLASFVAIAKGDVPQEHWFRLGRQMAPVRSGRALIAWTATMFEYLMPVLVMKRYDETLLEQTYASVVRRQIEYGTEKGVPWGVSEAGYNARDLNMNYQYGPFGVPGLGLKRGLSDDLVISPYSTMLGALIDPRAALENLKKLMRQGALGRFGFYESIDYTVERLPAGQKFVTLHSYMAHHQGMSLVAMNNLINDQIMQRRFHADTLVSATELLLQERVPRQVQLNRPRAEEIQSSGFLHSATDFNPRAYNDVHLSLPRTQILSNGTYSVMVTSTGAGYSRCNGLAISRWREDPTRDNWGQFFYINKRGKNQYWSATYQPAPQAPENFGATFAEDKVDFWRRDGDIVTRMEVIVSPEDNVELRRITLINEAATAQELEVTSFMEAVLARPNDDAAHPAFSNLFVQTEFVSNGSALIATRRKRSNKENPPWAVHILSSDSPTVGALQYETDRSRFIGRGRNLSNPIVVQENRPLSNTTGSVLDPIFSLRQTFVVEPGKPTTVTFVTGLAPTREAAFNLVDKYRNVHLFKREAEIAWTQCQVQLRHLNITNAKAHTYQRLAGRILYLDFSLRPSAQVLAQNKRAQSNLWAYGISGDIPIILTQISDEKDMSLVRDLLHAHEYFRLKGLSVDLVILNQRDPSYLQTLQDEIGRQIRMSGAQQLLDKPGGIFLRRTDLVPHEDIILLRSVARVILSAEKGTLEEQLRYRKHRNPNATDPMALTAKSTKAQYETEALVIPQDLNFFNGLGGFTPKSDEYVIVLKEGQWTPAPWINVIANQHDFGFIVTDTGLGYTWSVNSRENRLTPWSNDPISDPPGEAIYIRDEDTGEFWSPTPLPIREKEAYVIRHGQGYTTFEHNSHGINQRLTAYVSMDDNVKISRLTLKNTGPTPRRLSVTSYLEWVLGFQRTQSMAYVIPEYDTESGALFARNPYNNEFASRVAFADLFVPDRTFTCDRREFIGRNGSLTSPQAMRNAQLSGTDGAGLDPCAAFLGKIELGAGEEQTITMIMGQADTAEKARSIVAKYREETASAQALTQARDFWNTTVSAVEIKTPDEAMNTLVNRWLPYQTLSCRIWARSAFYQSGGAFGFRDQLQDVMAMVYAHPQITRAQIITAAERQFVEGDVQHWWHPPSGRGVRTHFSDDLIWLPFVVSYYIRVTGDTSILDERVSFIEAPILQPGQEDSYTHPSISSESATIFEHSARTLDRSLKSGRHGLPLMGAGDWNDGMSRVGHEGQGESVWVAWFLYNTLEQFLPHCERDQKRAAAYTDHLAHLKEAVESNAWDGDWYRRAYFDDGTPLGSTSNEECRIDSISNSWSVLSGAADPSRAARAMSAVEEYLIHRGDGLIKLFTPPFDKTPLDPGYIKGYVPGVRENGGQYTHAAIWTLMAFAQLGDGDKATELYALLNPINHASTRSGLHKYKVEPYVVAADIYGMHPHVGRGGWTWYTGSASWMYRAAVESILGFDVRGHELRLNPKISSSWREFEITYRRGSSTYHIKAERSEGSPRFELNGQSISGDSVLLADDGKIHHIKYLF